MVYKIKRYSSTGLAVVESFQTLGTLRCLKVGEFAFKEEHFATYIAVLDYEQSTFYSLLSLNNCFMYVLPPVNKMIFVLKDSRFMDLQPYEIDGPISVGPLYLGCCRIQDHQREEREVYKLLNIVGTGFDVIKVTHIDPLSSKEIPSISREIIDFPLLFRDQEEVIKNVNNMLCSHFINEQKFNNFYTSVEDLIHYGEESIG